MSGAKTTTSNTVTPWVPDQTTFDTFKERAQGTISPEYTQAMQKASAGYSDADAAYAGIAGQYAGMNAATDPSLVAKMKSLGGSGLIPELEGMAGQSAGVDGGVMQVLRDAMDPNARSAAFDQVRQNTINSIMPSINSSFAGSGMTGSSLHAQNLSKGLSAGVADVENQAYQQGADRALTAGTTLQGILSNDFDQRLGSARAVQNATFTDKGQQIDAAKTAADFDNQEFARRMGLLGAQGGIAGARAGLTGAQAGLASDQQATSNAALMGLLGTATGAASTTQTTQKNPGLFGILGAGAQIASLFSDKRLKRDAKRVGRMDDGTPIYTYRYKDGVPDPTGGKVQMGVMAQDVAEVNPAAVSDVDGFLAVDYGAL